MTKARRQAALDAGASASAIANVEANGSVISVISEPDGERERRPQSPPTLRGRGRSADRRPISPHVAFRPLYQLEEDEETAARAAARSNLYLPGTGGTGEPLSDDPATALEAADLDLPTDACGHEVRTWRSALGVELPLLVRSTIPVFFTQLAEYSLSLASVVSIGHLGTKDLAASSLANMTASVTCFSIMQGLATSLDTLLPAAWTGADRRHVGLWSMRCTVVMIVAMVSLHCPVHDANPQVPMFVLWFNIEVVLLWLKQDPHVASLAGTYLAWLSIGIPGYAGNVVLKKYLQSQNIMHIPTYVLFVVAPLNVLLNWLLVWGPKPVRLGFIGGAIATAFSFNLTFIMLFVYVMWWGPRDSLHPFSVSHVFSRLGTVTQLGLAGTVMVSHGAGVNSSRLADLPALVRVVGVGGVRFSCSPPRLDRARCAIGAPLDVLDPVPVPRGARCRCIRACRQPPRRRQSVGGQVGRPRRLHPGYRFRPLQQLHLHRVPAPVGLPVQR
jgi:MATE family multidrug resistance protein